MPSALLERLSLHSSKQIIPAFVYGTAWKKEQTADLVHLALSHGFTGVDTAAQPKHYREDLVGEGVRRAISDGKVSREDLFIQTKFTTLKGQDLRNLPYGPNSSVAEQIHTSVKSSLYNLRPSEEASSSDSTTLDCLILHSPLPTIEETIEAWRELETYVPHKIRALGISNVYKSWLQNLYESANIKPAVVQNRFVLQTQYDREIRAFCAEKSMIYQSFWTLTGNTDLLHGSAVGLVGDQLAISKSEALYCMMMTLDNVVVLNGTTNEKHMLGDLAALDKARKWAEENPDSWRAMVEQFHYSIKGV